MHNSLQRKTIFWVWAILTHSIQYFKVSLTFLMPGLYQSLGRWVLAQCTQFLEVPKFGMQLTRPGIIYSIGCISHFWKIFSWYVTCLSLCKIEARPWALVKVHLVPSDINTIMPTCTCCKLVQYCTTYMCIHLVLRASEEVAVYIINIHINWQGIITLCLRFSTSQWKVDM